MTPRSIHIRIAQSKPVQPSQLTYDALGSASFAETCFVDAHQGTPIFQRFGSHGHRGLVEVSRIVVGRCIPADYDPRVGHRLHHMDRERAGDIPRLGLSVIRVISCPNWTPPAARSKD